jgi:GT2 family glycosyltransferase
MSDVPISPQHGKKRVAVVVVTYQAAAHYERCIASLVCGASELSVIVVDNASSDGSAELIESRFPQVKLLSSPTNLGFGQGNNLGIQEALRWGADYVFLFNQDAYVVGNALDGMVAYMEQHGEVGVCSPMHCSPDESRIDPRTLQYYISPHAPALVSDALLNRSQQSYITRGVNAAAWFVRAEVIREAGVFDPLYFMYAEDDDLLDRWERRKVAFALLTAPRIVHLRQSAPGQTGWLAGLRRRRSRIRSNLVLHMKRAAYGGRSMWRPAVKLGIVEALLAFAVERRPQELLASLGAAVAALSEYARIRKHAQMSLQTRGPFLEH